MRKANVTTNKTNGLFCNLFGHHFEVSKNVTYHVKEYKCSKCGKEMTTNSNGFLTELTPKFREINNVLSKIHNNKLTRLAKQKKLLVN